MPYRMLVTNITPPVATIPTANARNLHLISAARPPSSLTIRYTSAETSYSWPEGSAMKRSGSERLTWGIRLSRVLDAPGRFARASSAGPSRRDGRRLHV